MGHAEPSAHGPARSTPRRWPASISPVPTGPRRSPVNDPFRDQPGAAHPVDPTAVPRAAGPDEDRLTAVPRASLTVPDRPEPAPAPMSRPAATPGADPAPARDRIDDAIDAR